MLVIATGNTKIPAQSEKTTPMKSSANGFDKILNLIADKKVELPQKNVQKTNIVNEQSKNDKMVEIPSDKVIVNQEINRDVEKEINESDSIEMPTEISVDSEKPIEIITEELEQLVTDAAQILTDMIQAIATLLNVTPEKILNTLEKLNIKVEDLQGQELLKFISEVKDIKNPLELLKVEGIAESIKQLPKIIDHFSQQLETITNQIKGNYPTQMIDQVMENVKKIIERDNPLVIHQLKQEVKEQIQIENQHTESETEIKNKIDLPVEKPMDNAKQSFDKESGSNNNTNTMFSKNKTDLKSDKNTEIVANNPLLINAKENIFASLVGKSIESQLAQKIDQIDTIRQMVDQMKATITDENTTMTMQLKPAHLGKLLIEVVKEQGVLTAKIATENQTVKEIVESNLIRLKQTFEEQGIKVQDVKVTIKYSNEDHNQKDNSEQQQSKRKNKHINNDDVDIIPSTTEIIPLKHNYSSIEYSA